MISKNLPFKELKRSILQEVRIIEEIIKSSDKLEESDEKERKIVSGHISLLKNKLKKENNDVLKVLDKISFPKDLPKKVVEAKQDTLKRKIDLPKKSKNWKNFLYDLIDKRKSLKKLSLEKEETNTLKRLRKKDDEDSKEKRKQPKRYVSISNKIFSNFSGFLIEKGMFKNMGKDLFKANLDFLPKSYISVIILSTIIAFVVGIFIFMFFMFFNLQVSPPFISDVSDSFGERFLKVFWIIFFIPIAIISLMYFYPSLEKNSLEIRIDQELPFATINMASISGSIMDPTEIFSIIVLTKEYPNLEKEFIKIINGVHILGYDLISVLRNSAFNSPSKNLSELFNGIATTITSGGDLPKFFDERSRGLLFEYNLEKEKSTRAAETFMDIYISVVIAAPMILMLLLIIMQISGLGVSLSTKMITLIIVSGVSVINMVFLAFLHLRQANEG